MPFMGGMEATELIRAYEGEHHLERTPIIALTAHASVYYISRQYESSLTTPTVIGDRERCLQAGMDDHITSKHLLKSVNRSQGLNLSCRTFKTSGLAECHHQAGWQGPRSESHMMIPIRHPVIISGLQIALVYPYFLTRSACGQRQGRMSRSYSCVLRLVSITCV